MRSPPEGQPVCSDLAVCDGPVSLTTSPVASLLHPYERGHLAVWLPCLGYPSGEAGDGEMAEGCSLKEAKHNPFL